MKRLLTLIPLILALAACTSSRTTLGGQPSIGPQVPGIESETHPPPVPGIDVPTDQGGNTPPPEVAAVANEATEISSNPLVRILTDPKTMADADTAIQINEFGSNNDRIGESCAKFFRSPDTLRKASELAGVKQLAEEAKAVIVVAPIPPIGLMSTIAEIRRVERDVTSGALSGRVAALKARVHTERMKLDSLAEDAKLACSALVLDAMNAPARDVIKIAPLIAQLRQALGIKALGVIR